MTASMRHWKLAGLLPGPKSCNPLVLALSGKCEGCVGPGFGMQEESSETVVHVALGEDATFSLPYFSDALMELGRLKVGASLCIEGPKVFHDAEPVIWVRNGIEGAVKLALGRLNQSMCKPVGHLALNSIAWIIWDLAVFDINRIVLD